MSEEKSRVERLVEFRNLPENNGLSLRVVYSKFKQIEANKQRIENQRIDKILKDNF